MARQVTEPLECARLQLTQLQELLRSDDFARVDSCVESYSGMLSEVGGDLLPEHPVMLKIQRRLSLIRDHRDVLVSNARDVLDKINHTLREGSDSTKGKLLRASSEEVHQQINAERTSIEFLDLVYDTYTCLDSFATERLRELREHTTRARLVKDELSTLLPEEGADTTGQQFTRIDGGVLKYEHDALTALCGVMDVREAWVALQRRRNALVESAREMLTAATAQGSAPAEMVQRAFVLYATDTYGDYVQAERDGLVEHYAALRDAAREKLRLACEEAEGEAPGEHLLRIEEGLSASLPFDALLAESQQARPSDRVLVSAAPALNAIGPCLVALLRR